MGEKQSQDGGRAEVSGESESGAGGSVETGEVSEAGELCEVGEAGDFSGGLLAAGGVTGELCEGAAAAGAEVYMWMPAPARRSSKAGRLEEGAAAADRSDSEASVSDCSKIFHTQITASQENKLYPANMFKLFLQQTKGMKGLDLEQHYPDKLLFYHSAKPAIKHRTTSALTHQEMFRLKKQMIKVREQLSL